MEHLRCAPARPVRARPFSYALIQTGAPRAAWSHDTEELRQFAVMLARRLGRGQFDPEDLAHEVLERWLRCAPSQATVANPRAWITVVLRRLLVDRVRRRRAAAEVPADCVALATAEPEAQPWWQHIEVGVVRRELGRLPPALRETFELFSFQARSYQEIAYELNIAMGTVGTRISRARALLKRRLIERWGAAAPRSVRVGHSGSRPGAARALAGR